MQIIKTNIASIEDIGEEKAQSIVDKINNEGFMIFSDRQEVGRLYAAELVDGFVEAEGEMEDFMIDELKEKGKLDF